MTSVAQYLLIGFEVIANLYPYIDFQAHRRTELDEIHKSRIGCNGELFKTQIGCGDIKYCA